ncbi:leucyl/phenylalanyl-tRNA--protein transferase [Sphingomonas jejuensis]|uniref:Leucyl/phenylalanyl-tRNA--protein transferase n=1 Tax=Sphingomonas jejuensis TaxID=904715 RepID=A0ABX0XM50_9SPHN|nr:leucyl/phenylalanyl-tRNA--protein transferase [Sphingomonas jejuensis]
MTRVRAIDPDLMLRAYAAGIFPMADDRAAADVYWVEPKRRGILPLDGFRLSRSLAKTLRSGHFVVTVDRAFDRVIAGCAEQTADRPGTWINRSIEDACRTLHQRGFAHSVECWQNGVLVGGLYGIALGRAFFGESMFSRTRDASKVALAHLVARLRAGGFVLLDCQFITPHLASLGAIEVPRDRYSVLLEEALGVGAGAAVGSAEAVPIGADFAALDRLLPPPPRLDEIDTVSGPASGYVIAQLLVQTSQTGCSTMLSDGDSLNSQPENTRRS